MFSEEAKWSVYMLKGDIAETGHGRNFSKLEINNTIHNSIHCTGKTDA